jgi:heme O synthase-like polyprenyltransferase
MLSRLLNYGRMIKFGHTVFALPFAFAGAALAFADFPDFRDPIKLLWITLAMIGARSAAMGFNRLMDRHIDASNPRTSMRELPAGKISARHTAIFVVFFCAALYHQRIYAEQVGFLFIPGCFAGDSGLQPDQTVYQLYPFCAGIGSRFGAAWRLDRHHRSI